MFSNNEEKKLDWMYKGPNALVDREAYLLGRAVDKTVEEINKEEAAKSRDKLTVPPKNHVEHECIPPSIRDYNKIVKSEQVDLQAKLQEDPLVLIKRQEEETRRQFLQNPVQLKKLQKAMEAQMKSRKRKKETKTDLKLRKKLKKLNKQLGKKNGFKELDVCSDDDEAILDTILMHKFNSLKNELSEDDLKNILLGNSSESEISDNDDLANVSKKKNRMRLSDLESDERQNSRSIKSSKNYLSHTPERYKNMKESSNMKERYKSREDKQKLKSHNKVMTEEEKEALRRNMMEHAAVRNAESAKNLKKYKEEHSKPEVVSDHNQDFLRNQLLKAANISSVADRIKSNVNNIQRSKFAMDSNFLK